MAWSMVVGGESMLRRRNSVGSRKVAMRGQGCDTKSWNAAPANTAAPISDSSCGVAEVSAAIRVENVTLIEVRGQQGLDHTSPYPKFHIMHNVSVFSSVDD